MDDPRCRVIRCAPSLSRHLGARESFESKTARCRPSVMLRCWSGWRLPASPAGRHAAAREVRAAARRIGCSGAGDCSGNGVERPLWTVDPFGGTSSEAAASLAAARWTSRAVSPRSRSPPCGSRGRGHARTRDLVLLAEADEEGGAYGTSWLAENHWDKIDASESLNEGGWIFAGRPRGAAADGHHDDRQELALGHVQHARDLDALLAAAARQRAAPLVRALDRVERYDTRRRAITPHCAQYLRAWARGQRRRPRGGCARSPRAERRGPPRRRDQPPRRPWGELFDGLAAQHLRADDRRRRFPRQRAARAAPRRRSTCACCPARSRGRRSASSPRRRRPAGA